MSESKKRIKIQRADYERVLVTETLPFETPLIFSNDGLYERIKNLDHADPLLISLIRALVFGDGEGKIKPTIPYLYKIRKDSYSFRRLALLHPHSQWKVRTFYEKYESLITYHCAQSPASIRAPHKVAGSFYVKSNLENLNQYKNGAVSLSSADHLTKHAPSFFAYKGFDRLYKFFESRDYFELEKQFSVMLTLDVTKCFDSIYTHTLSWAVKDKEFTKQNLSILGTFAAEFDSLMMHANHGETNGIVIGPEVSRIFAEIIFQEVDVKAITRIKRNKGWGFGKEYAFRRYVDDVFIFAETEEYAETVYSIYADVLLEFNLHTNLNKRVIKTRPFVTDKSRVILAASSEINNFVNKFLDSTDNLETLKPRPIQSTFRLTRSFIESIKVLCSYNQVDYDAVGSFLMAVLAERVKKLVAVNTSVLDITEADHYRDALIVLLDALYFLYEVAPSVSSSYKFCTSIILIIRFTKAHLRVHFSTIAQRIYELTEVMLEGRKLQSDNSIQGFLPLEVLNVVLAARELGNEFLMPEKMVKKFFCDASKNSCFSIVSCLFYIQDEVRYSEIKKHIIAAATSMLDNFDDIRSTSEKAYLLLDLLSCPFIPEKSKRNWLKAACGALGIATPTNAEANASLKAALTLHSSVNWSEVDLLNTLEKKELKRAY